MGENALENREKGGACTHRKRRGSERMGKAKGKKRNADRSENLIWSLFHRIGQGKEGQREKYLRRLKKSATPRGKADLRGREFFLLSLFFPPLSFSSSFCFFSFFFCGGLFVRHYSREEGNLPFSHLSEVYFARWNFSVASFELRVSGCFCSRRGETWHRAWLFSAVFIIRKNVSSRICPDGRKRR